MKRVISLKYGNINAKKILISIGVFLLGVGLIFSGIIFWDNDIRDIICAIFAFINGFFFTVAGGYYTVKYVYAKSQIKKCQKDGVSLKAYVKGIANPVPLANYRKSKLRLIFEYGGNKKEKYSETSDSIFTRIVDGEADILYSPKYDQVLILQEK